MSPNYIAEKQDQVTADTLNISVECQGHGGNLILD